MVPFAIFLISLGALNAVLAVNAGTCTQGDAGNLYGGLITAALYVTGGLILTFKPVRQRQMIALLPAAAVALWHSVFALRFVWGYLLHNISACDALVGDFALQREGYEMDGGEAMLALLWFSLSSIFWIAITLALLQVKRRTVVSAD